MNRICLFADMTSLIPSLVTSAAFFRYTGAGLLAIVLSLTTLTPVFGQPVITQQPMDQTNLAGTTATFTVSATGAGPLSYQWRSYVAAGSTFTNLPFGTEATLVLTNVQPTTRLFAVVVTDAGGLSATSSPLASLTVLTPPSITVQPTVQIMMLGATATFVVTAIGTAPLAYQWRFNDADVVDKTTRTFSLANAQLTNAGNYSVVVTNAFGSATSRVAGLMFTTAHRLSGITASLDGNVSLNLAGVAPSPFAPYYDIFPLEVSTNLLDWSPLAMLQRVNDSTDAVGYRDTGARNLNQRFYRTPTNFLTTPFPKPSGPYPVGTLSRLLTDPSRIRNTSPTNSSFMVQFWYPAEARAGVLPEAWIEHRVIEADPSYWSPKDPSILVKLLSHAIPGLPLATNQISYPLVIYSSTWGGRRQNTDKALELASHGFVVVGVDHIGVLASVFPSGQVVYGKILAPGSDLQARFITPFDNAIKDLRFVLDELIRFNNNDTLFAGRLDLERLGAFGFSVGSTFAAEFCRLEPLCKAVAIFDAGYIMEAATNLYQLGLQKPFLYMNSTGGWVAPSPGFGPWLHSATNLFAKATADAFWFRLQDSTHASYSDPGSLVSDPTKTGDPTPVSRAQSQAIRACTLSFFNKYLKGEDDHLLDDPAAVYTNIINYQRK
jgi:hypothetical protein